MRAALGEALLQALPQLHGMTLTGLRLQLASSVAEAAFKKQFSEWFTLGED